MELNNIAGQHQLFPRIRIWIMKARSLSWYGGTFSPAYVFIRYPTPAGSADRQPLVLVIDVHLDVRALAHIIPWIGAALNCGK
jgi:hypothetical protein